MARKTEAKISFILFWLNFIFNSECFKLMSAFCEDTCVFNSIHLKMGTSFKFRKRWLLVYSYSLSWVGADIQGNSHHINVRHIRQWMLVTWDRYQSLAVHTTLSKKFNDNISRCNLFQDKFILPHMPAIFYLLPSAWSNISGSHKKVVNVKVILMNQRKTAACVQQWSLVMGLKLRQIIFLMEKWLLFN